LYDCLHSTARSTIIPVRVVLDTNVLVAAMRSRRGASFELLSRIGKGAFDIAVSVSLVLEYESVLLRHVAASRMSEQDIRDLIDYVCDVATWQEIFFLWRPYLRDANDDLILELAVAAGCDAVITHNIRDFSGAERLGIRVLTPGMFLQDLKGSTWER
jgi:putative PIN family toxin of toxin-antitoxin system